MQERASSAFVLIQMLRQEFADAPTFVVDMTDDILAGIEAAPVYDGEELNTASEISIVAIEIVQEMALLFAGDLNPVAPKAQRKVQLPDGLDLDVWINTPPAESSSSSEDEQTDLFVSHEQRHDDGGGSRRPKTKELTAEELNKVCTNGPAIITYQLICMRFCRCVRPESWSKVTIQITWNLQQHRWWRQSEIPWQMVVRTFRLPSWR